MKFSLSHFLSLISLLFVGCSSTHHVLDPYVFNNRNPTGASFISSSTDGHKGVASSVLNPGQQLVVANPKADAGTITAKSSRASILGGLVDWADGGVGEAAQKAGIQEITTVDRENFRLLWGLYSRHSTVVTGNPKPCATTAGTDSANHVNSASAQVNLIKPMPPIPPQSGSIEQAASQAPATGANQEKFQAMNNALRFATMGPKYRELSIHEYQKAVHLGYPRDAFFEQIISLAQKPNL